mgnify:CR=1 FL=1
MNQTRDLGILFGNAFVGIHQNQTHIRALNGIDGAHVGILFDGIVHLALAAHTGGVDEAVFAGFIFKVAEELGNGMHRGTVTKLRQENIPFTNHRARQITAQDYNNFDYLIGMDQENLYYMEKRWPNDTDHKISLLLEFANLCRDIADPWYTGNFDKTYADIQLGCQALLEKIKERI